MYKQHNITQLTSMGISDCDRRRASTRRGRKIGTEACVMPDSVYEGDGWDCRLNTYCANAKGPPNRVIRIWEGEVALLRNEPDDDGMREKNDEPI